MNYGPKGLPAFGEKEKREKAGPGQQKRQPFPSSAKKRAGEEGGPTRSIPKGKRLFRRTKAVDILQTGKLGVLQHAPHEKKAIVL